MSHDEIAAAAREWAAANEDGTVQQAVEALGLDGDRDARIIIRGVLARAEWDREAARQQAGQGQ